MRRVSSSVLHVADYNALFVVTFAVALFNSSMGGHVRGSICLAISGTRAVVVKIQLDLIWGTMATRRGKICEQQGLYSLAWDVILETMWLQVIIRVVRCFQGG